MNPSSLKAGQNVVFKQRIARHLAANPTLPWEYEHGHIVFRSDASSVNICWLQGHHSRNDDVPFADVVAVYDGRKPSRTYGGIVGPSRVIEEPVPEGSTP